MALYVARLGGVEQVVRVRVAALIERCHACLIIGDGHIRQRLIAGVLDDIGPRHRRAHPGPWAPCLVGIESVGRLLDFDSRLVWDIPVVVRWVGVIDLRSLAVLADSLSGVLVLTGDGGPGGLVRPRLGGVEQVVRIRVAALIERCTPA